MKKYKHIIAKVYGEEAEPKYHITPKGCALLALADANIEVKNEECFNSFWDKFQEHMENAGYIKE